MWCRELVPTEKSNDAGALPTGETAVSLLFYLPNFDDKLVAAENQTFNLFSHPEIVRKVDIMGHGLRILRRVGLCLRELKSQTKKSKL